MDTMTTGAVRYADVNDAVDRLNAWGIPMTPVEARVLVRELGIVVTEDPRVTEEPT